ncbi:hypothetical protein [Curtobacterium sp. MCBA15_012]|uniref:hypothetical protein n=1 Tax=Curtobacterium sp. MCBA15_012 TaxID=1898738 RepID=UPI0008DD5B4D|nr:hypothetical protein [Curtobacterium sp. MCBA15_012]WIA98714.1 hypothetical protein QOL15_09065 [Curtobacterium sp. MCBA15_012]
MTTAPVPVRIVVAGTAGGVGTTTVAALLFEALRRASTVGAPVLYDHSGGDLGLRLPNGDDVSAVDDTVAVHDAGPHAMRGGLDALTSPSDLLVVVAPANAVGLADADLLVEAAARRSGLTAATRIVVVVSAATGDALRGSAVEAFRARHHHAAVLRLPADPALAVGGRIPSSRLTASTRRALAEFDRRTVGLLATQRRGGPAGTV